MPRQGGPGRAGLRPHQPGLTGADDLAARGAERRRFRSASPTHSRCSKPQNPARPVLAAPAGAARARRVIRPSCHCSGNARSAAVPSWPAQDPLDHLRPRRGPARRRARRTLTATAGRVMSITDPASSRTGPSPAPARAIWLCRHDAGDPGFLAGPGDRLVPVGGPAQRHGGETPAARARASRTSPGRSSPPPRTGGPGKAAELRLLEWETAAPQCGGSPATATLPCTPSWASGSGFPGRRTHLPARLCVPGGPALRPETGSLR